MLRSLPPTALLALVLLLPPAFLFAACGSSADDQADERPPGDGDPGGGGKGDGSGIPAEPLNQAAGDLVIYELQVRSANACHPATGGEHCAARTAPTFPYYGPGCGILEDLQAVKKSTFDDLLAAHDVPHRSLGVTLQYVDEVVGANTVWLMPHFPHNFAYDLPDACDDIGSPYAVRDYYHARGSLADRCVAEGRDEGSEVPCWADEELQQVIAAAHERGLKVMLDLAFNHLGHEYHYYDYAHAKPVRDYLQAGDDLWDFETTHDPALLTPTLLDDPRELPADALDVLSELCPARDVTGTHEGVRRYLMWREAFDGEREAMSCDRPASLEQQVPGFYLGAGGVDPSQRLGDNYTNDWRDVKFLYHGELDTAHQWEFVRTRELAFRVINYYLSLGVDAFRLDHANGLTEGEWRYIFRKARRYQRLRGGPEPVFLAESFHEIPALNRVFDVLTEGYHHDICRGRRWATDLEFLLFENRKTYLDDLSYVLLNLETHDEGRLLQPSTGFDVWRGVTFYALAAAGRGALMLQAGQEWGEPWDLGFRRSDYLRGRFLDEPNFDPRGDQLSGLYGAIHHARLADDNVALRRGETWFLRTDEGEPKQQLLAMVRYMPDCSNTLLTFFRLWVDDVQATFSIPPELAHAVCLDDSATYSLIDVLSGQDIWAEQHPTGRTGHHLREFGVFAHLDRGTSFQWLRLQRW